nr:MAG: hypothetical protein [Bacteriophage sp.]
MKIYSKGFMELVKVDRLLFCRYVTAYVVLLDGWYEAEIVALSDDEAIEKFLAWLNNR